VNKLEVVEVLQLGHMVLLQQVEGNGYCNFQMELELLYFESLKDMMNLNTYVIQQVIEEMEMVEYVHIELLL
jgi:hypothetical protein